MNGIKSNFFIKQTAYVFFICSILLSCKQTTSNKINESEIINSINRMDTFNFSVFKNWNASNREGEKNLYVLDYIPKDSIEPSFRYIIRKNDSILEIEGQSDSTFTPLKSYIVQDTIVTLEEIIKAKDLYKLIGSEEVRNIEGKRGLLIKYHNFSLIHWLTPIDSLTEKYSMYKKFNKDWMYYIN